MKLEIYKPKKEEKKEQIVRLALEKQGDTVVVAVVDEDGEYNGAGNLIGFRPDGTIERYMYVGKQFGFQLDDRERVKLEGG